MNERSHFGVLIFTAIFAAVVGYRLPETIIPEHYDLTILTNLDEKENFTFSGTVLIQVRALEEINSIVLHSKELEIIENEIVVKAIDHNDVIPVSNVTYNKDVDFLIIGLDKALNKNSQYEVKIPFKGIISNALVGYYRSSFKNGETGEKEWLAVTQFEANYARNAFPCFDEPILKATFSISLGRKEGLTSLSNMPLLETQPIEGMNGWYCDKYEKSVPMSTYLVAYMVSPFEYVQSPNTDSDILFRIWARKDAINQTRYASEIGPKVLSYYEKYFDVPYPLPKQDMIAVPDFYAGAMENWGIITYRENALLYQPNVSSTSSKFRVASVVAHELAHQWFGNLVTMKWWTDLWLNEGFATYVSILGVHHVHPEWNVLNEEAVDNLVDVFRLDSLNTSHPVSVPIGHPSEIDQIFDVISYKKGSAIIRMMNLFLGEEVFRDGVSSYLKKYKYKNAEQNDLWQSLTDAAHAAKSLAKDITVKEIMDSWTKQTGYPIINIERNYADNTANVSQKVYQSISENKNKPNTETWWVPLSFTSSDQIDNRTSRPSEWLRKASHMEVKNMPNPDSWVLFNVDMAGLYRVKYDDKNWELLTNDLKKPSHGGIPTLNRMQLVLDSMDLAWTGQLSYNMSLRLLEYINNEEEYIPWRGAMIGLGRIDSILKRTPDYGIFKKYMRKLIAPAFKKTGGLFNKVVATPDRLDSVKHQILISSWACRVDVPSCKEHALELFDMWMKEPNPDEKNDIPSDLRSEVYCTGINRGGEAEWDFLWKRYLNTNIASEREILLRSLGCTSEVWMMKRILEWSITEKSGIRQQDAYTVFDKIGSSEIGYYVAKHFLYEKANDIRKYHKATPSVMGRYIRTIAGQISSRNELKEFSKWIEDNHSLFKESSLAIGQSLESGIVRLEWKDIHQKTVVDVLKGLI